MSQFSPNSTSAKIFTLTTKNQASKATLTNYGARLVSLAVPDRCNQLVDVVLGFNTLQEYLDSTAVYFGATIGRFANRISNGKFTLDSVEYTLPLNNGPNCLHGGVQGFHSVAWDARQTKENCVEMEYLSRDMEEAFPGELSVKVTYTLEVDGNSTSLRIEYEARTDRATVVNLTNHAYFNLNGEGCGDITGHVLRIYGDEYLPVDDKQIPTGQRLAVTGTPFDFTTPTSIGSQINADNQQLKFGSGYDHCWVLNKSSVQNPGSLGSPPLAASVIGDLSHIKMDVFTHEPGIQFYSGNFLQAKNVLKAGAKDEWRSALCLETQRFPNSPNHPEFPSSVLRPGETYRTCSVYSFCC